MNPYIIQSSLYLSTIYEAIIAKQEILRAKMQQYNDVKLYLFSFILPEYSSNEYIVNSLKLYNENELFPIIITSITYKEVDNPRIAFKNENGIIHLVLCLNMTRRIDKKQGNVRGFPAYLILLNCGLIISSPLTKLLSLQYHRQIIPSHRLTDLQTIQNI